MSSLFLHAWESSFLVMRCESSHLLELAQLHTGGGAALSPCLSVCPSAEPVEPRDTPWSPFCRLRGAMGWIWDTEQNPERLPRDAAGSGKLKVSIIQPNLNIP